MSYDFFIHGVPCICRPYWAHEYPGKHIVGIGGRVGDLVDQLTFHYSDGTTKSYGDPGGEPIETQTFDPAKEGHIVKVDVDFFGKQNPNHMPAPVCCQRGYKFHLEGGRVIQIAGKTSSYVSDRANRTQTILPPQAAPCCCCFPDGSVALPGHELTKEDGTPIKYVLEDILMSTWHGSSRTPNRDQWPYAGIWQEAPELSASPEGSDQQGVQMAAPGIS